LVAKFQERAYLPSLFKHIIKALYEPSALA
jgi:hypothetical protein